MRIPLFRRGKPKAIDPVCHMEVDTKTPPGGSWDYEGITYYFCGPGCNRAFQKGSGLVSVRRKANRDVGRNAG